MTQSWTLSALLAPPKFGHSIHRFAIALKRRWNGENWDFAAVPAGVASRRFLKKGDIRAIDDPAIRDALR